MTFDDLSSRSLIIGWLAALWSGAYDKVEGRLHVPSEGHCIQGVLLDQLDKIGAGHWNDGPVPGYGLSFRTPTGATECGWIDDTILTSKLLLTRRLSLEDIVDAGCINPYSEHHVGQMRPHLIRYLGELNDETDLSHKEMAEHLHTIYIKILNMDLPPKAEIKALADADGNDNDEVTEEGLTNPEQEDSPFVIPEPTGS